MSESRPSLKQEPSSLALIIRRSLSITSMTAIPIAHDTGFPPKVLKNSISPNEDAISGVVNTAAIGWPFPPPCSDGCCLTVADPRRCALTTAVCCGGGCREAAALGAATEQLRGVAAVAIEGMPQPEYNGRYERCGPKF